MPKKTPKNAFFFFMMEHVENERRRGRNISMIIAQSEVDATWKRMTKEERAPYIQKASVYKLEGKLAVEKYTSDGRVVSALVAEENRKAQKLKDMVAEITGTIDSLTINEGLESHYFYIIHINHFTVTRAGVSIPAEIAAVQFNLLDGEISTFHRVLSPFDIPIGDRYVCVEYSDKTHKIPVPPYTDDRGTLAEPVDEFSAFDAFVDFLYTIQGNRQIPILYASRENIEVSRSVLQRWVLRKGDGDFPHFKVYEIDRLLFHLKKKCVQDDVEAAFPTETSAIEEIARDVNCYATNISCRFHSQHQACEDRHNYCSLSWVRRLMYVICDHCCPPLNIDLVPGGHIHAQVDSSGATALSLSKRTSGFTSRDPLGSGFEEEDGYTYVTKRGARRGMGRGCRFND